MLQGYDHFLLGKKRLHKENIFRLNTILYFEENVGKSESNLTFTYLNKYNLYSKTKHKIYHKHFK